MNTKRILAELKNFFEDSSITGIKIFPHETNMRHVDVLIIGNKDTPYECGFFWFKFIYPITYPFDPPEMKFMTTDNGTVRFNPNLYEDGKVCLSLLNTWGQGWSSINTITNVLVSIQSMVMHDKPVINEPGHEKCDQKIIDSYSKCVKYHTLAVAMKFLNGETDAPRKLVEEAKKHFNKNRMIELCSIEKRRPEYYDIIHHRKTIDFGQLLETVKKFNIYI